MPVQTLLNLIKGQGPRGCSIPAGERVYAIGDIHGRLDLLQSLVAAIDADDRNRPRARTTIIFLGDLVDRGPDSRGVVEWLMRFAEARNTTRFLTGNHEEVFLRAVAGDLRALRMLIRIGGRETILSYGITPDDYRQLDFDELLSRLRAAVPEEHVRFLSAFEEYIEMGDYVFVHAGLRPGIGLADQSPAEMRWIREAFLDHRGSFEKFVVHGHSISEEVEVRSNRIGIDTGAFASGRLTAIGLEGDKRWFLST